MKTLARYLAARVVDAIINKQGSLATQLPAALDQANPKDRALVTQLVYGSCPISRSYRC